MKRWIAVLFFAFGLGMSVFVWAAIRATEIEQESAEAAALAFSSAKAPFSTSQPIVRQNGSGDMIRRTVPESDEQEKARHLHILAFEIEKERLSRTRVPLWFLSLKERPLRFLLARTGADLAELDLSVDELRAVGPRLVFDEAELSGSRVLIWTE